MSLPGCMESTGKTRLPMSLPLSSYTASLRTARLGRTTWRRENIKLIKRSWRYEELAKRGQVGRGEEGVGRGEEGMGRGEEGVGRERLKGSGQWEISRKGKKEGGNEGGRERGKDGMRKSKLKIKFNANDIQLPIRPTT